MGFIARQFVSLFKQLFFSGGRAYSALPDSDIENLAQSIDRATHGIGSATIAAHGSGYAPGDTGYISGGTPEAIYKILTVVSSGFVRSFKLTFTGFNYVTALGVGTVTATGVGTGFTVNILSIIELGTSEKLVTDGNQLLNSILPDNPNFTDGVNDVRDNDCNDWERRLGLKQYGVTDVPTTPTRLLRMAAIAQKMRYPGTDAPRQAASYLQACLQSAGFPVYVYENPDNLTAAEVLGVPTGHSFYGSIDYGEADYGEDWSIEDVTVIANSVDPAVDALFTIPAGNNHGTFFIGGNPLGTFATIPAAQETQFRQLVLNLKPAHMAAITFILFT